MLNNQNLQIAVFNHPFKNNKIRNFIEECYRDLNLDVFSEVNPFLFFIVIYDDKNIFGFLQATHIYERIEIEQFYVLDKYRGCGYGNKLIQFLIDYAMKNNCDSISLEVRVDNMIAINLYKKFGFEIVAVRNNYYKNIDAYLMVKKVLVSINEE